MQSNTNAAKKQILCTRPRIQSEGQSPRWHSGNVRVTIQCGKFSIERLLRHFDVHPAWIKCWHTVRPSSTHCFFLRSEVEIFRSEIKHVPHANSLFECENIDLDDKKRMDADVRSQCRIISLSGPSYSPHSISRILWVWVVVEQIVFRILWCRHPLSTLLFNSLLQYIMKPLTGKWNPFKHDRQDM